MIELKFRKNAKYRSDHRYDLVEDNRATGIGPDIKYLLIRPTKRVDIKGNGAKYILESFSDGKRTIFTGLRQMSTYVFIGDIRDLKTNTKYKLKLLLSDGIDTLTIQLKRATRRKSSSSY